MKKTKKNIVIKRLIHSYLSSVISISLVLILAGIIGLLAVNAGTVSNYFKENIKISVIFQDNTSEKAANKLLQSLKQERYVKGAEFISKEKGTLEMKELLGEEFLDVFEINPIPMSVDLFLKANYVSSDSIDIIKKEILLNNNIKELVYQESLVETINNNFEKIGVVFAFVISLLLFVSFVLINNTVRLNVFSKRYTIHTMKMVGAKRSFIRKPFLIQGFYQGLISGALSASVLLGMLFYIKRDFLFLFNLLKIEYIIFVLMGVVVLGIVICLISTFFVVNKLVSIPVDEIYY